MIKNVLVNDKLRLFYDDSDIGRHFTAKAFVNAVPSDQIMFQNAEDREKPEMTREEAINKLASVGTINKDAVNFMLNVEALGLIKFKEIPKDNIKWYHKSGSYEFFPRDKTPKEYGYGEGWSLERPVYKPPEQDNRIALGVYKPCNIKVWEVKQALEELGYKVEKK